MIYRFTITEHDPEHPWLVISNEHREVELDDRVDFDVWAKEQWPDKHFKVRLDPGSSGWWEALTGN